MFIVDDDEFEIAEREKEIIIVEKEAIPEDKIIANEKEQQLDMFNELVRLLPENKRTNRIILDNLQNVLNNCIKLKINHSLFDENNDINGAKLKTENYKPLMEKYLENNYDNKFLIPIINSIKDVYLIEPKEDEYVSNMELLMEDAGPFTNKQINKKKIDEQIKIRLKYRKSNSRLNYSYKNELNETYNSMTPYQSYTDGYNIQLKNDTELVRNCIDNDCLVFGNDSYQNVKYDKCKLIGDIEFQDNKVYNGEEATVSGFLKPKIKQPIKNLLNNSLKNAINNPYNFTIPNMDEENVKNIELELNISDNVDLCFYEQNKEIKIKGIIVDIEVDNYIIKPINEEEEYSILKIPKNDKGVIVSKNIESCDDENETSIYMFPKHQISMDEYKRLLNHVIPNNKKILYSNINEINNFTSLDEIEEILKIYSLEIHDITHELFAPIAKSLNSNIQKLIKMASSKDKIYQSLKTKGETVNKKDIKILNRKILESLKEFYGSYPFYGSSIDSNTERYKWIKKSHDNGALYYKNIVVNIIKNLSDSKDKIITVLNDEIEKLTRKNHDLIMDIDDEKHNYMVENQPKCSDYRLVKIYNSLKDLEDDNKKQIAIDEDKVIYGSNSNIVQPGDYCILKLSETNSKLYKRINLESGELWVLESGGNMDKILESNREFCIQQAKNIEEIDKAFLNAKQCDFNELENKCEMSKLITLKRQHLDVEEKLKEKQDNLRIIQNSEEYKFNLDAQIERLKRDLLLHNDLERKVYEYNMESYEQIKVEVDEENQDLYRKINMYLETINKLPDEKMYPMLNVLYKKYGRNAENETENPLNIYCKVGKKVLFCKHHLEIMKYYDEKTVSKEILENLLDEYSIEDNGSYICKNCGQQLYIGKFEEIEGFEKSGARLVTTEVVEEDPELVIGGDGNKESEMLESLQKYLNENEDKTLSSENLDIIKIIKVLTKLMGVELNLEDEMNIYKNSNNLIKGSTKTKDEWIQSQRKLPKNKDSINNAYNMYKTRNTILYTSSQLFITLQISIPEYFPTKPHPKCTLSLMGYPLEEDINNTIGVNYIACLLENLRLGTSSWSCLKKIKIREALLKIITQLIKDDYIVDRYSKKREYLQTKEEQVNEIPTIDWKEFKPPLDRIKINIDIDDPNNDSTDLSLKKIEIIDDIINSEPVENTLYTPTPLGNSCCLDTINSDLNYDDFFDKKSAQNISKINDLLKSQNNINELQQTKIIINSINQYSDFDIESFNKQVFPEEISQLEIMELYVKFIDNGIFLGREHIYDENGICLLTGQTKKSIMERVYSLEDYNNLIEKLNVNKLFNVNHETQLNDSSLSTIKLILESNSILNKDSYLNKLVSNLEKFIQKKNIKKIDELWGDLEQQVKVENDELINIINTKMKLKGNMQPIIYLINMLGELQLVFKENVELYGQQKAEVMLFTTKERLIKQYLNKYLLNGLNCIKNKKYYDEENDQIYIPEVWKIDDSYKEGLKNLVFSNTKYIKELDNNETNFVNNIINTVKNCISKIHKLKGKEHHYSDDKLKFYSDMTHRNSSYLLHYIFLYTIKVILDDSLEESILDDPVKNYTSDDENDLDLDRESEPLGENDDIDKVIESNLDEGEFDLQEASKNRTQLTHNIVYSILKNIVKKQEFDEKHTSVFIEQTIEKKQDIQKEENLRFIEELSKESRQSFKSMIALGLETWKQMTGKDKTLYFESAQPGEDAEYSAEELNEINRGKAQEELGDNYNEEQYQAWLSRQNRHDQEDRLAYDERDILEDDDE